MENIQIFIYSVVQGITEFLPVSSSAHLYVIQDIYNWKDNALLLALGAHLGTFLALIVFNRKLFINFKNNHLLVFAMMASLPIIFLGGIIGLFGLYNFKILKSIFRKFHSLGSRLCESAFKTSLNLISLFAFSL